MSEDADVPIAVAPVVKDEAHTRHVRSVALVIVLLAFGALLYAMTLVKLLK